MNVELTSWMMVFVRVGAMLSVFPVFSDPNFPKRVRLALGALVAWLVVPTLPAMNVDVGSLWSVVRVIALETMIGLLLGFSSKMIFYALDMAGGIVANEIGLQLPASVNPMSGGQVTAPGMLLNYLAAVIWLSLDLHHWLLLGFQRTYFFLPVGGGHLSESLLLDLLARFRGVFVVALQMAVKGLKLAGKVTPHDEVVTKALGYVLTGGDADSSDVLTEQQILDLEYEQFMTLIKTKGTLARIEHMLDTGKPLRN